MNDMPHTVNGRSIVIPSLTNPPYSVFVLEASSTITHPLKSPINLHNEVILLCIRL